MGSHPTGRRVRCVLVHAIAMAGVVAAAPQGPAAPIANPASLLKDTNPGGNGVDADEVILYRYFTGAGGVCYFPGNDGVHGLELWRSDGTTAGTALVKDIEPGAGSSWGGNWPGTPAMLGGTLYFMAYDAANGLELWKSDGTETGTTLVKDINPGSGSSFPRHLRAAGATLLFSADDGTHGRELWRTDGTEAGTVLVRDINVGADGLDSGGAEQPVSAGGILYFVADDGTHGAELWKSDGTEAGTVMVKDINPGSPRGIPQKQYIVDSVALLGEAVYFVADDGASGAELWKSDGTDAGTVLLKDIRPGPEGYPYAEFSTITTFDMRPFGGALYFMADDGTSGREVWKTDGTEGGTMLLKDINPGSGDSLFYSPGFAATAGSLFFAADDGTNGRELWRSDGTEAGTVMVEDIYPGSESSEPYDLLALGSSGAVLFSATDPDGGNEMWFSDGTGAGTLRAMDILPGTGDSEARLFTRVGDTVYFLARTTAEGREVWTTTFEALGVPPDPVPIPDEPLPITRLRIDLGFSLPGRDRIDVAGTLPVPAAFDPAGATVSVDVGGVARTFTLDARGKSTPKGPESFRIALKRKKGVVQENPAAVSRLSMKKGDYAASLADEGLTGGETVKAKPCVLPVSMQWQGKTYAVDRGVSWTATQGKKGKAK